MYPSRTVVVCAEAGRRTEAERLARMLGIALVERVPAEPGWLVLVLTGARLQLQVSGPEAPGAVYADFLGGRTGWRGRHAAPADEALARAAGVRGGGRPDVIDTTAGLGRDAFVLAAMGCRVTLVERHPVVAALLADALARAAAEPRAAGVAARMELIRGDARGVLATRAADVVLVDPMHPPRRKAAAVRKEMRVLRALVGADDDSDALLAAALTAARRRVVVKRPRGVGLLAGPQPSGAVEGVSTRFDIYAGRAPGAAGGGPAPGRGGPGPGTAT